MNISKWDPSWRKQLVKKLLTNPEKIELIAQEILKKDVNALLRIFNYTIEQTEPSDSEERILAKHTPDDEVNKNGKTVVCTCMYNGYDILKTIDRSKCPDTMDFICFTDYMHKSPNGWELDTTPYHKLDTEIDAGFRDLTPFNMVAKYYKMLLHRIPRLQPYSRIIYIDSSILIHDFSILEQQGEFIIYNHCYSTNGQEVEFCRKLNRYAGQPLEKQIESYYAEGFKDQGHFLAGFYFRDNTPALNRLFEYWHYEVQKWTDMCQLSLPFIIWLFGAKPMVNMEFLYDSKKVSIYQHCKPPAV